MRIYTTKVDIREIIFVTLFLLPTWGQPLKAIFINIYTVISSGIYAPETWWFFVTSY